MAERLSLNEVSRLLKMSPADLRAKCEAGEVAGAERAGGHWFFSPNVVKQVAEQLGAPLLEDLPASLPSSSFDDLSKMEISTANLDGGLPNPFGDIPNIDRTEPTGGADVLFGDLDEGGEDNNMRTVMGSADDLARPSFDQIRLDVPKEEPLEDTAVLSGELDIDDAGDDMRTVMGSAALFGGDQQIGLRDANSGDFGQPFAAPSNAPSNEDDDAAVLGGELEAPSGDMHTLMGTAAQFGGDRPSADQVRIDAHGDGSPSGDFVASLESDDDDAAVLGGELEAPSGDMHTMMGGAAQFGLGNQADPINLTARHEEPSPYHEAFGLDEASDETRPGDGGMRTMVGDASQLGFNAESVRLDLTSNEPPSSITSPTGVHATEEDSDDVGTTGMHTMVGDASQFGLGGDQVKLNLGDDQPMFAPSDSSLNSDAAVLSGDLDVDDSNDAGTLMGSAAELAAAESGEVKLDSTGNTPGAGSSINDDSGAVLSGDLDVDDSGDMRTALGGVSLSADESVGLSAGDRDDEPSAIDQSFDEVGGEGGGMRTMVGDASQLGLNQDEIRLDFTGRGDEPAGSSITEAISPAGQALEDSDDVSPTGGMRTMVGDAADFGFHADQVRVDLAGRDEVPLSGSSLSAADSSVNLVGSSINDDSGAVLSGDLDVDDSGDMRTIMGGPDQFAPGETDRINVSSALDDGSAVLSGDLDAEGADAGDMRTLMASSQTPPEENIRVVSTQSAGESDALVLSGNLDASESSSSMRTELGGAYGGPLDSDDDAVHVADVQRGDSSDRILLGQEDLGDSSDYSPTSPTLLGISPLDSGSADQVVVGSGDVIDSDLRMNMVGGPRPGESDVRLVPDQTNIDSDIRVSQLDDANDSGGGWTPGPHNPSDSHTFASDDATPTLPEASQDLAEGTPGILPPNPIPEESDLSINMESPDAGDEFPTATFIPTTPQAEPAATGLGFIPVSYTPAADDTAELAPQSIEEDEPADSDVTPGPFYVDDDMTLAEHSLAGAPAPSSSGPPQAPVEYADEELTIAEGIDMKPSPDKTSLSMNKGAAPQPADEPQPHDSGLTIGAGDELLLAGSDVISEPLDSGVNTSMVNLDPESEEFVLGGGSDITIDPGASGIGLAGSGESGIGLAGSGIDLADPPVDVGAGASGLTLGESEDEFLLKPSDGGSGAELDADSDSGSQVIALDASSEDVGAYSDPTMLGGDPYATPTMLGGDAGAADPYAAAGGLPDPMMNPGVAAGYAQPGYGAATPGLAPQVVVVPRVEVEYTPMQIVSLSLVALIMVLAFLMMIDLTVLNGAQWNGIQWTGSFVKPLVDLVGY